MKILTAGIFTVLLAAVSTAASAASQIASTNYVDGKVANMQTTTNMTTTLGDTDEKYPTEKAVKTAITTAVAGVFTAPESGFDDAISSAVSSEGALKDALDGKQDKLTSTHITGNDAEGVVTGITANDGTIAVTKTKISLGDIASGVIPGEASSASAGLVKLYDATGQNTDGAMTQKATSDELAKKQDSITVSQSVKDGVVNKIELSEEGTLTVTAGKISSEQFNEDVEAAYNWAKQGSSDVPNLKTALDAKADATDLSDYVTSDDLSGQLSAKQNTLSATNSVSLDDDQVAVKVDTNGGIQINGTGIGIKIEETTEDGKAVLKLGASGLGIDVGQLAEDTNIKNAITSAIDSALREDGDIADAIETKIGALDSTESGTGNVVINVTQSDGKVTVTKGKAKLGELDTSDVSDLGDSEEGDKVLVKKSDGTLAWESIAK